MQENPFADLIPKNNQQTTLSGDNPFSDLIPKKQPSIMDRMADSIPTNLILGAGDAVANQLRNVADLAPGVNLPEISPKSQGNAYNIGNIAGDILGYTAGGIGLDALRGTAEAVPLIGQGAQWLGGSGLAPTIARLGSGGAVYGGIMSPDNRTQGATIGGLLGGAGGAAAKAFDALMPASWRTLSPEQLQKNLDVTKGTETNLGDVVGSPNLKKFYENQLAPVPFGGVQGQMSRTADEIGNRADNILSGYLGNTSPLEVEDKLGQSLIDAFKNQTAVKNNLYSQAEDTAEKSGFRLNNSKLSDVMRESQNALKNIDLDSGTSALLQKAASPSSSILSQLKGENNISDLGLKDANILASKLNALSKQYRTSPAPQDKFNAATLGKLGGAIKSDIKSSINDTGNESLINQFSQAEKNYKDNYSSFLDKDIYKFLQGKPAEEILSSFIKTGRTTDKGDQLNKLMSKLDPEAQNLVKYSYLSRAMKGPEDDRNIDPQMLKTLWSDSKLGQNQKMALMNNPAERKAMDNLTSLIGMNTEPLSRMANPQTGVRWQSALPYGAAIVGATHAGPIGGLLASGGAIGGAQLLSKALTNEAVRRAVVRSMLKTPPNPQSGLRTLGTIGALQSSANQYGY